MPLLLLLSPLQPRMRVGRRAAWWWWVQGRAGDEVSITQRSVLHPYLYTMTQTAFPKIEYAIFDMDGLLGGLSAAVLSDCSVSETRMHAWGSA